MNPYSMDADFANEPPVYEARGDATVISLGRIRVMYPETCEAPQIRIAGQPMALEMSLPPRGTKMFVLGAGLDSILISDRESSTAMLVPRTHTSLQGGHAPVYVTEPDLEYPGRFCVRSHGPAPQVGVLYIAQAFGHTTGQLPAVHGALARHPDPTPFTAAIRRKEDAVHAQRKAARGSDGIRVVPLYYDDSETATITHADVVNASRPELLNREAALLWIADNLVLARASAGAAVIVNDCRPETWILHQLAEHAQQREVPLHAMSHAFEEFPWLRQLARQAQSAGVTEEPASPAITDLVAASEPAIHTRRALEDALRASGIDPQRNPSADFEAASRRILGCVSGSGTIWYQAVNWRDWLSLEAGAQPYVVIPPLGQPCVLSPEAAAARAGALLAQRSPALQHIFTPHDPRGVVLVAQGSGLSAYSRRHWRAMLALAARMEETQFLFAGGSTEDRAWLSCELARSCPANVTLLGWLDEDWSTFLRALGAKPRAAFVCRPGLSSIGSALVNGIPPLLMSPDPLTGPDGTVDAVTAEVAMGRAVYAFQLERLYATRCAAHRESPLPVLVDTLGDDREKAVATVRRALDPVIQLHQRAAIDGYCNWSRVTHLIAQVLAREAASGAIPIQLKRRLRNQALPNRRAPLEGPESPGPVDRRAYVRPVPSHPAPHGDGMQAIPIEHGRLSLVPKHE